MITRANENILIFGHFGIVSNIEKAGQFICAGITCSICSIGNCIDISEALVSLLRHTKKITWR